MHRQKFKERYSLGQRSQASAILFKKYPDLIPVIVEIGEKSKNLTLKRYKYLAPRDTSVVKFNIEIRRQCELFPEGGIYLFVNNTIPSMNETIGQLYGRHHDQDGFLYIHCCEENIFG